MQTDPLNGQAMSLQEAAKSLPGRPHVSTLHRWRARGVKGVRLECVRVGGRWYVTRKALQRFLRAVTAAADRGHKSTASANDGAGTEFFDAGNASPTQEIKRRDQSRVESELDRAGISKRSPDNSDGAGDRS